MTPTVADHAPASARRAMTASGGQSSTTALAGSTEHEQFYDEHGTAGAQETTVRQAEQQHAARSRD